MSIESITQTFVTGDNTVMYFGIAVLILVVSFVFAAVCLVNYKKRADLELWYKTKVVGYKVGIIEKAAKDEDVEIVEMKRPSVAEVAREELEHDLKH